MRQRPVGDVPGAAAVTALVVDENVAALVEQIFDRLKKHKWWQGKIAWLEKRADTKGEMVRRYSLIGLCLLVAVPLPGTGAWTGSLVAALMKIKRRQAVPVIFAGVMIAGLIVLFFYSGITFILS